MNERMTPTEIRCAVNYRTTWKSNLVLAIITLAIAACIFGVPAVVYVAGS